MLNWIAPATLTGCPATVARVGRTPQGLPVGTQIVGRLFPGCSRSAAWHGWPRRPTHAV
ncbi:MAG TPA: hypothetical protein VIJ01_18135 [Candidatus Angelobacter sp.]